MSRTADTRSLVARLLKSGAIRLPETPKAVAASNSFVSLAGKSPPKPKGPRSLGRPFQRGRVMEFCCFCGRKEWPPGKLKPCPAATRLGQNGGRHKFGIWA